jgi:hypothetical protein
MDHLIGRTPQTDGHRHAVAQMAFQKAGAQLSHALQVMGAVPGIPAQDQRLTQSETPAKFQLQIFVSPQRPVDGELDHLVRPRLFEQTIDLDPRKAQPLGDGRLRQFIFIIERGNLRKQILFRKVHGHWNGSDIGSHPCICTSNEILHTRSK